MLLLLACAAPADTGDTGVLLEPPDVYADAIVSFEPGDAAGYGQELMPDVVLGAPAGGGSDAGGLDVLSLGDRGVIVIEFVDLVAVDGPGPDILVFENPFPGWLETGIVSASADGDTWYTWPCDAQTTDGCAGVNPVHLTGQNGIDPTDVDAAGGDAFDLADLGLATARFLRIEDTGSNPYEGTSGGFDLDGAAVVNAETTTD